ncbi:unnamed protein product [Tuber aestivum]|uniref:Uncharacterized protein n=1 Tax=Tuber aestivum TaxID=59557 RepID=A0A292PRY4_9PEZI|nr:unnamed protein product [Tuber aestivum]
MNCPSDRGTTAQLQPLRSYPAPQKSFHLIILLLLREIRALADGPPFLNPFVKFLIAANYALDSITSESKRLGNFPPLCASRAGEDIKYDLSTPLGIPALFPVPLGEECLCILIDLIVGLYLGLWELERRP